MNLQKAQENSQKNYQRLMNKCWEDESFKQNLIESPEATLEQFFGTPPRDKGQSRIVVNDQTDSSVLHINIPPKPNVDDLELTDAELEAVAGGEFTMVAWTLYCHWD